MTNLFPFVSQSENETKRSVLDTTLNENTLSLLLLRFYIANCKNRNSFQL